MFKYQVLNDQGGKNQHPAKQRMPRQQVMNRIQVAIFSEDCEQINPADQNRPRGNRRQNVSRQLGL